MPRPGFVLEVDRSTPPLLFWRGEGFSLERLPAGRTRVVYAPEPLDPVKDVDGAIRRALLNPVESDPLPALLFPGMKLTIAFDDVSLPLPKMRRPDLRQRVIEAVLDVAAEAGVDDVHLIAALALHRRMTEAELRHAVGDRVYDAFAPDGRLYNHDAEDPDNLAYLGSTDNGEEVEINKRAAESDLIVYVNINLVAMDGGWKSTATGLASYRSLRHHHNVSTMQRSKSFMDQHHSELHKSNWRLGKVITDAGVKVFQIETTLNTDIFPDPFGFLAKREWEWSARERGLYVATTKALARTPQRVRRKIFQSMEAPHQMTGVNAGGVEAVHRLTTERVYQQQLVPVEGQTDILTMGIPYICPYNVDSIMNPILVMCTGLGYYFNFYRGKPLVREGGVVIMTHPTYWDFHPVHHPSYIDFFEQVLADTTDPLEIEARYEKQFAEDEWYRHLYRTSYAYHGVHPFYMWYWGAHGLQHAGPGHHRRRQRAGGAPARLHPRLHHGRRAGDGHRRGRPPSDHHPPAHAAVDDGGRAVGRARGRRPAGLPAPLQGSPRRGPRRARVRRTTLKIGRLGSSVGFPYRRPTRAARRRGAEGQADAGRGLRHGVGPPSPGPHDPVGHHQRAVAAGPAGAGLAGGPGGRSPRRPASAGAAAPGTKRRRGQPQAVIFTPNHHSHLDTPLAITAIPEPWRSHLVVGAAADYFFTSHVTSAASALVLNAFPVARNVAGRQSADLARGADRGWLEPGDLPRGRPLARRVGSAVQGRRGLPVHPDGRTGGARVHRGRRLHPRQGHEAAQAGQDHRDLRRAAVAGGGREHPPLQRAHRAGRHGPRRRDAVGLVVGPPACGSGRQPGAHRARAHRLAPRLGAVRTPQPRPGRPAPAPATPLARPRVSAA